MGFCFGTEQPAGSRVLASRVPVVGNISIIVSKDSPFAAKKSFSAEDLRGKTLYAAKSNMANSLDDDYFRLQECTIIPFELTMQNIYEKTRNGELIISPNQFAPLFSNLLYLPLLPLRAYFYYIIYRKESNRAVKTLVNAYLDYVSGR